MFQFKLRSLFWFVVVALLAVVVSTRNWDPKPIRLSGTLRNRSWPNPSGVYSRSPERTVIMELPEVPRGPRWLDTSENPPLSAAKAIEIANRVREKVNPEHGRYWQFQSAELCPWDAPNGFWYWEVSYILPSSGHPYQFTAVVMMDGTPATAVETDEE